jgi:hypothetical protein
VVTSSVDLGIPAKSPNELAVLSQTLESQVGELKTINEKLGIEKPVQYPYVVLRSPHHTFDF